MIKERNIKIDFIKFLGLFAIILAHVGPNEKIFQLRNFDVPLMVFISGFLSYDSYKKSKLYLSYLYKRIKRIVIPTWIFLIIYFMLILLLNKMFGVVNPYNKKQMLESFLFLDGIGYVWIVRVYLLIEIILPLLIFIIDKLKSIYIYLIIVSLFLLNELLCIYGIYGMNKFNSLFLCNIVGYGIISLLGLVSRKMNKENYFNMFLLFSIIFLFYVSYNYKINHTFIYTQLMKYPPRLYYLSYSMIITYLLMLLNIKINNNILKKIIVYSSKNSFWIYLWHILFIFVINIFNPNMSWYYRYIIISILSLLTIDLQNLLKNKLNKKIKME